MGVCDKHWPNGFIKTKKKGGERPANPSSVFKGIPRTVGFLELVLLMWKCLNIRLPILYIMLNDKNRKPFSDFFNERLTFLQGMASMLQKLGLTLDTNDVLHVTLNGIFSLIPKLVTKMK